MKVIAYGDIMDSGVSKFNAVAAMDGTKFILTLSGVIRIDFPYKHLSGLLEELERQLPETEIEQAELDFRELTFCNSNGFYIIMDMVELVYQSVSGLVTVKRLRDDDWQQETLPILLNTDEPEIEARTQFEEHEHL